MFPDKTLGRNVRNPMLTPVSSQTLEDFSVSVRITLIEMDKGLT